MAATPYPYFKMGKLQEVGQLVQCSGSREFWEDATIPRLFPEVQRIVL
jgi:hypothetical protein